MSPLHQVDFGIGCRRDRSTTRGRSNYYAQEPTPWSAFVRAFSTQHAICLFYVEGPRVRLETVKPETLEVLDRVVIR